MHDAHRGAWIGDENKLPAGGPPAALDGSGLEFTLGNDPALFGPVVSAIGRHLTTYASCREAARYKIELALHEALANALFHGNLEVASQLRIDGDGSGYYQLAERRRQLTPYRDRTIDVQLLVGAHQVHLVVRDQGPGFDTSRLHDDRLPPPELPCGRGLLLMRSCMDEVSYNRLGNQVRMTKLLWPVSEVA